MSKDDCIKTLANMHPYGHGKTDVLYDLAKEAADTCIVEVGTGRGYGAIALAYGSRDGHNLPVYCIDPHFESRGWTNEPYGPVDRAQWYQNITTAGVGDIVSLVGLPINNVIRMWSWPPALTFWDIGAKMTVADAWLRRWIKLAMRSDSVLAINETSGNAFGVDQWLEKNRTVAVDRIEFYIRITKKL